MHRRRLLSRPVQPDRPHRSNAHAGDGRLWGIIRTAFLFAGLALQLTGCRHPAPMVTAWVHPLALEALHPNQAMETDLAQRIATLQVQRAQLLGHARLTLPPGALTERDASPVAALPEPPPSPHFNQQTDRFRDALLSARTKMLANQQQQEMSDFLRRREEDYEQARAKGNAALTESYTVEIAQIKQTHAKDLLDAKMSLDLARYNSTKHPKSQFFQTKLAQTVKSWEAITNAARDEERIAAADLAEKQTLLKTQLEAAKITDIAREQQKSLVLYAEKNRKAAADIAEILAETPFAPRIPTLEFSPFPDTTRTIDVSILPQQAGISATRITSERQRGAREIDQTIADLIRQRQQLHAQLARETREAVTAVAAQHGYQVSFSVATGEEITTRARIWMQQYWGK